MPYRDKVYGTVAGRTGLDPVKAKQAADAAIEMVKTKMPPVLSQAVETMLQSEGGNILWEFVGGKKDDHIAFAGPHPVAPAPKPAPDLGQTEVPGPTLDPKTGRKKSYFQRIMEYWKK